MEEFEEAAAELLREVDEILAQASENAGSWSDDVVVHGQDVLDLQDLVLDNVVDLLVIESLTDIADHIEQALKVPVPAPVPMHRSRASVAAKAKDAATRLSPIVATREVLSSTAAVLHFDRAGVSDPQVVDGRGSRGGPRHRSSNKKRRLAPWLAALAAACLAAVVMARLSEYAPADISSRATAKSGQIQVGDAVSVNAQGWQERELAHSRDGVSRSGYRAEVSCEAPATLSLDVRSPVTVWFRMAPEPLSPGSRQLLAQLYVNGEPVQEAKPIRQKTALKYRAAPGDRVELRVSRRDLSDTGCDGSGTGLLSTTTVVQR
jgi:hypothetical protein